MTITLSAWAIPLAFTIAVWAWGILWPIKDTGGDYNFGAEFTAFLRLGVCTVTTLAAWLLYFAARVAVGV